MLPQKETSHWGESSALGPPGNSTTRFLVTSFTWKIPEYSDSIGSSFSMLANIIILPEVDRINKKLIIVFLLQVPDDPN